MPLINAHVDISKEAKGLAFTYNHTLCMQATKAQGDRRRRWEEDNEEVEGRRRGGRYALCF